MTMHKYKTCRSCIKQKGKGCSIGFSLHINKPTKSYYHVYCVKVTTYVSVCLPTYCFFI